MDAKNIRTDLEKGGLLIDVRSPEEFAEGHVVGAELIPHMELFEAAMPEDLDTPIYLYCKMGPRAELGVTILQSRGYTHVTNLGGLEDMEDLGFNYSED